VLGVVYGTREVVVGGVVVAVVVDGVVVRELVAGNELVFVLVAAFAPKQLG
jgi:hypothetical protein